MHTLCAASETFASPFDNKENDLQLPISYARDIDSHEKKSDLHILIGFLFGIKNVQRS